MEQDEVAKLISRSENSTKDAAEKAAWNWCQILPFGFAPKLGLAILLYLAYAGYTLVVVLLPGMRTVTIVTSQTPLLPQDNSSLPFPTVFIATPNASLDQSAATFMNKTKCILRNFSPYLDQSCHSALDFVTTADYNTAVYSTSSTEAVGPQSVSRFLQIQLFYTFDPSVTRAWYAGTAYSPTVFVAFSPYPFDPRTNTTPISQSVLQGALPVDAGSLNYAYIRQVQTTALNGSRIGNSYEASISAVTPADPISSTCATSGCVFNLAISFSDTIKTEYREQHLYDRRSVAIAMLSLFGTPWAIAGVLAAVANYQRAKTWEKRYGLTPAGKRPIGFFTSLVRK